MVGTQKSGIIRGARKLQNSTALLVEEKNTHLLQTLRISSTKQALNSDRVKHQMSSAAIEIQVAARVAFRTISRQVPS